MKLKSTHSLTIGQRGLGSLRFKIKINSNKISDILSAFIEKLDKEEMYSNKQYIRISKLK